MNAILKYGQILFEREFVKGTHKSESDCLVYMLDAILNNFRTQAFNSPSKEAPNTLTHQSIQCEGVKIAGNPSTGIYLHPSVSAENISAGGLMESVFDLKNELLTKGNLAANYQLSPPMTFLVAEIAVAEIGQAINRKKISVTLREACLLTIVTCTSNKLTCAVDFITHYIIPDFPEHFDSKAIVNEICNKLIITKMTSDLDAKGKFTRPNQFFNNFIPSKIWIDERLYLPLCAYYISNLQSIERKEVNGILIADSYDLILCGPNKSVSKRISTNTNIFMQYIYSHENAEYGADSNINFIEFLREIAQWASNSFNGYDKPGYDLFMRDFGNFILNPEGYNLKKITKHEREKPQSFIHLLNFYYTMINKIPTIVLTAAKTIGKKINEVAWICGTSDNPSASYPDKIKNKSKFLEKTLSGLKSANSNHSLLSSLSTKISRLGFELDGEAYNTLLEADIDTKALNELIQGYARVSYTVSKKEINNAVVENISANEVLNPETL